MAAEKAEIVEQLDKVGRWDPDVNQELEEAQDDLKIALAKLQKKLKFLHEFVNVRNGEMAGDGTRAVKRLMSRQFQETFNLAAAAAVTADAAAAVIADAAAAATAAAAAAVTADAAAAATAAAAAAVIDLTAAAVTTAQVCTDQYV